MFTLLLAFGSLVHLLLYLLALLLVHQPLQLLQLILGLHFLSQLLTVGRTFLQIKLTLVADDHLVLRLDARFLVQLLLPVG